MKIGIRAFLIDDTRRDAIMTKIYENIKQGSNIITDEFKAYYWLYSQFNHDVVNHSQDEYKKGKDTNTVVAPNFS